MHAEAINMFIYNVQFFLTLDKLSVKATLSKHL